MEDDTKNKINVLGNAKLNKDDYKLIKSGYLKILKFLNLANIETLNKTSKNYENRNMSSIES